MSLYDDIDTDKKSESLSGWASGIKFLQSHMQLKKATMAQPKRDFSRKQPAGSRMSPVVDLKAKAAANNDEEGGTSLSSAIILPYSLTTTITKTDKKGKSRVISAYLAVDPEWQFDNEYDPMYPNDYEKALKEMRDRRDKEAEESESKRRVDTDEKEEDEDFSPTPKKERDSKAGVAIAPPPSLTQSVVSAEYGDDIDKSGNRDRVPNNNKNPPGPTLGLGGGSGVSAAARIMAKYGYKEGQGLGKKEQGMSTALQVEKTSHRIGRIIHEKDIPKEAGVVLTNPLGFMGSSLASSYIDDEEEIKIDPTQLGPPPQESKDVVRLSMADTPSKVVLLTNMVGPGEVDDDLEPEVKEECEKYGEVLTVTVFQMPDVDSEDAIRIFVEFTEIESARKAIADLNGRYFGGREVKAHFYDAEKFNNLELTL
ncbi:unnamed protein product [Orchesella dallaii]|uniref:Splicing factor 45 n=1 Tax=Orchesella dallaii TaxID=48710 RepID=A0ABP1QH74_9HEXA